MPGDYSLNDLNEVQALKWIISLLGGTSSPSSPGAGVRPYAGTKYNSTTAEVTADGSIPVGALAWSVTCLSGTATLQGTTLAVGETRGDGGYPGLTLGTAVPYTITGGALSISYGTLG